MAGSLPKSEALEWQVGVWNRMSDTYVREIDKRFIPVVEGVLRRADLSVGDRVLDLGTGTGAVAAAAAEQVGPDGRVVAVDPSPEMLQRARSRFTDLGLTNVTVVEGPAEDIPAGAAEFDVVTASLSLMYVIDRKRAAEEMARVLRPGGRLVASVWAGPADCDIVLFQTTAGCYAGPPPVPGVGPGAMADTGPFVAQLEAAGISATVETETLGFGFSDLSSAWDALAGVTTANLPPDVQQQARSAVLELMYPDGDGPRYFRNTTRFIVGERRPA